MNIDLKIEGEPEDYFDLDALELVYREVLSEYVHATWKFGEFKSRHDAVGIIEEEFLEFRDAAFWPHKLKPEDNDAYTEAKQLAAMSIRFMVDIGKGRTGHGNER